MTEHVCACLLLLNYRWAVKEATYKAFQRYRVLFPEIRLVKQSASDNGTSSAAAVDLFTPVQTKLPVAESSQALRLEFYGETLALVEQLSLVVRGVNVSIACMLSGVVAKTGVCIALR